MGERWQPVAAQCSQRAAAQATALQAGDAVVADWRAHVEMMQNKPHTDPNAYGKMWRDMVNAAPPHLDGFSHRPGHPEPAAGLPADQRLTGGIGRR